MKKAWDMYFINTPTYIHGVLCARRYDVTFGNGGGKAIRGLVVRDSYSSIIYLAILATSKSLALDQWHIATLRRWDVEI